MASNSYLSLRLQAGSSHVCLNPCLPPLQVAHLCDVQSQRIQSKIRFLERLDKVSEGMPE
jgi:hypothetical protein